MNERRPAGSVRRPLKARPSHPRSIRHRRTRQHCCQGSAPSCKPAEWTSHSEAELVLKADLHGLPCEGRRRRPCGLRCLAHHLQREQQLVLDLLQDAFTAQRVIGLHDLIALQHRLPLRLALPALLVPGVHGATLGHATDEQGAVLHHALHLQTERDTVGPAKRDLEHDQPARARGAPEVLLDRHDIGRHGLGLGHRLRQRGLRRRGSRGHRAGRRVGLRLQLLLP
mmetsp:Transcript_163820/g.520675  ORF Transcript_163820/g.520675 Transcript_163820/m.520675 type:complete len:226 (+) Transcript_163820:1-678(+)